MKQLEFVGRRLTLLTYNRARFGWRGLAGLLLLAAAGAALWWAPRLADETAALQARGEAARAQRREVHRSQPQDPAAQMAQFRAWFPTSARNVEDLRALFQIARQQHIVLTRGDYSAARRPDARLETYDVVLPVRSNYAGVRAFVAATLNELPHASLEELRMERSAAGGDAVEARVHFTLYYRED